MDADGKRDRLAGRHLMDQDLGRVRVGRHRIGHGQNEFDASMGWNGRIHERQQGPLEQARELGRQGEVKGDQNQHHDAGNEKQPHGPAARDRFLDVDAFKRVDGMTLQGLTNGPAHGLALQVEPVDQTVLGIRVGFFQGAGGKVRVDRTQQRPDQGPSGINSARPGKHNEQTDADGPGHVDEVVQHHEGADVGEQPHDQD